MADQDTSKESREWSPERSALEAEKDKVRGLPSKYSRVTLNTYVVERDEEGLFIETRNKKFRPGHMKHVGKSLDMREGGFQEGDRVLNWGKPSIDNEGRGFEGVQSFTNTSQDRISKVHWSEEGPARDAGLVDHPKGIEFDKEGRAHQFVKRDEEGLYVEVPAWKETNPEAKYPSPSYHRSMEHMVKYRPGAMKGLYERYDMGDQGIKEGDQIRGMAILGYDGPTIMPPTVHHSGDSVQTIKKGGQERIDMRFMRFESLDGKQLHWHMEGKERNLLLERNPRDISYGEDGKALPDQNPQGFMSEASRKLHQAAYQAFGQKHHGYG